MYQNMLIMLATVVPSSMTNVEVCNISAPDFSLVPDISLVPSAHTIGLHVEPSSVYEVLLLTPVTEK